MLNCLAENNLIDYPSYTYKKLKEQSTKIEIFKKDDLIKLLNYLPNLEIRHQLIILLLIGTGIRRNEVVNIKKEYIDLKNKSIYLEHTKSGKPRYCFFNDKIEDVLLKQLDIIKDFKNPYLFPMGNDHLEAKSITSLFFLKKQIEY